MSYFCDDNVNKVDVIVAFFWQNKKVDLNNDSSLMCTFTSIQV